jgi:hypothetical protein
MNKTINLGGIFMMSSVQPMHRDAATVTINIKDFFAQAFTFIKDKVVTLAKTVFTFLKDTAWPATQTFAQKTWTFLRTPAGFITTGGALALGLAYLSTKVNSDEQPILKAALQVAAVASFVGVGVVIGLGIANGFTAVLF